MAVVLSLKAFMEDSNEKIVKRIGTAPLQWQSSIWSDFLGKLSFFVETREDSYTDSIH